MSSRGSEIVTRLRIMDLCHGRPVAIAQQRVRIRPTDFAGDETEVAAQIIIEEPAIRCGHDPPLSIVLDLFVQRVRELPVCILRPRDAPSLLRVGQGSVLIVHPASPIGIKQGTAEICGENAVAALIMRTYHRLPKQLVREDAIVSWKIAIFKNRSQTGEEHATIGRIY